MIKGMADADEVEVTDVQSHSISYEEALGIKVEPRLCSELPSIADAAESACTLQNDHSEVILHAEVSCSAGPIGHVMDLPTACVSGTSGLQAELLGDLSEDDVFLTTRGEFGMIQVDCSLQPPVGASRLSSSASSSSSSSVVATPRKPEWEEVRGRSKCEIKAVLSLGVVSEQLRARNGKGDMSDGADAWAQLAAAGA